MQIWMIWVLCAQFAFLGLCYVAWLAWKPKTAEEMAERKRHVDEVHRVLAAAVIEAAKQAEIEATMRTELEAVRQSGLTF